MLVTSIFFILFLSYILVSLSLSVSTSFHILDYQFLRENDHIIMSNFFPSNLQ